MSIKRKLIIAITAMTILLLFCVYYILMVPHTAEMLAAMCRNRMGRVSVVSETLTAETEIVIDQSDVGSLKEIGEESITVPLTVDVRADCGNGTAHVNRAIEFTAFDEVSTLEAELYYDEPESTLYVYGSGGWSRRKGVSAPVYDLNRLFALQERMIGSAAFGSSGGRYTLTFPADAFAVEVLTPFVRDAERLTITSGEVTFYYDKRTKVLSGLSTSDVSICGTAFVGTPQEEAATSRIDITASFEGHEKLDSSEYGIPEKVIADADQQAAGSAAVKRYIISTEDLIRRDKTSYTAGTDIPAGKYIIRYRRGAGILKVLGAEDGEEVLTYKAGYNYYKIDSRETGKEAELNDGDKIILTGDDYVLTLESE